MIMGIIMPMSTTGRHNRITGTIFGRILDLLEKNEVYALHEEGALVHWGKKNKNDLIALVDVKDIHDVEDFTQITINELDYVQPDFFLFKENPYLHNERETKVAGFPDLIVEVWSKDNTKFDRELKLNLYSSSPITEHWYIEQDANEVICYFGRDRIKNQSLTDILVTRGGLEFDLRYLAI
jgi:Uma2 family endonuclease